MSRLSPTMLTRALVLGALFLGVGMALSCEKSDSSSNAVEDLSDAPWYELRGQWFTQDGPEHGYNCMLRREVPFNLCPDCLMICQHKAMASRYRFERLDGASPPSFGPPPSGTLVFDPDASLAESNDLDAKAAPWHSVLLAPDALFVNSRKVIDLPGGQVPASMLIGGEKGVFIRPLFEDLQVVKEKQNRQDDMLPHLSQPLRIGLRASDTTRSAVLFKTIATMEYGEVKSIELPIRRSGATLAIECEGAKRIDEHFFDTDERGRPLRVEAHGPQKTYRWLCKDPQARKARFLSFSQPPPSSNVTLTEDEWIPVLGPQARAQMSEIGEEVFDVRISISPAGLQVSVDGRDMDPLEGCAPDGPTICLRNSTSEKLTAHDFRRLYHTMDDIAVRAGEREAVVTIFASDNLPAAVFVRTLDVVRHRLAVTSFENDESFSSALVANNPRRTVRFEKVIAGMEQLEPRPVSRAMVIPGPVEIEGDLDSDAIRRVIRSHRGELQRCYEGALKAHPELRGRIELRIITGPQGSVSRALISETSMANPIMEKCLQEAVAQWTFPQTRGDIASIELPLNFSPTP